MNTFVGYQKLTADGAIKASGVPVAIWGLYVESTGGGGAVVSFYDGTSTSGVKTKQINGTTNQGVDQNFERGRVYPNGCFVDIDTNTSYVIVWYESLA